MGYQNIIETTADINSITNSKDLIKAIELEAITVNTKLFATGLLENSNLIVTEPLNVLKIESETYVGENEESKLTLTLYSIEEGFEIKTTPQNLFKDVLAISLDEDTASEMHANLQQNHRQDIGASIEKYQEEEVYEELDMDSIMEVEFEKRLLE